MTGSAPITRLSAALYRSIRRLDVALAPLTVISGPNGSGKSTLFRVVALLQAAARGDLSRTLAAEGGLGAALWAGPRPGGSKPLRMRLGVEIGGLSYEVALGAKAPTDAALELDAIVKEEVVTARARGRVVKMMTRKGPHATGRDEAGRNAELASDLWLFETALSRVADPRSAPEPARLKALLADIAIYDGFRADAASPLRAPQPMIATLAPAADGADWAAAIHSRIAIADGAADQARSPANLAIADAFPGAAFAPFEDGLSVEGGLATADFPRPFRARELSEGTLRYLALVAALTPLRPPGVILLNEPEASLNPRLIEPLSRLIAEASRASQLIVATHDERLAEILDIEHGAARIRLEKREGETAVV